MLDCFFNVAIIEIHVFKKLHIETNNLTEIRMISAHFIEHFLRGKHIIADVEDLKTMAYNFYFIIVFYRLFNRMTFLLHKRI